MQIGKLGTAIIIIGFIALFIAVLALAFPGIGQALHDAGAVYIGPTIIGGVTWVITAPLGWGATGFWQGIVVWGAIVGTCMLLWAFIFKRAYNTLKSKLSGSHPTPVSTQPTMTQPQTVLVKEVPVSTKEETK